MSSRPLNGPCKVLVTHLSNILSEKHLSINNMGPREGCVVDVHNLALEKYVRDKGFMVQTSGSVYISGKGDVTAEVLVPQCATRNGGRIASSVLVDRGTEICTPCSIDHLHIHSGRVPLTHVHVECDYNKLVNPNHCLGKIAELFAKAEKHAVETCGK